MKAIILYDKLDLAMRAKAELKRAAEQSDTTTRWNVKRWRVNLLTLQGIGKAALNDSVDAHLIVLALRQSESLPIWLPAWLEKWAGRRQFQKAALAVFDATKSEMFSAVRSPELSRFLEFHKLNFVSGDTLPKDDKPAIVARISNEQDSAKLPTVRLSKGPKPSK